MTPIDLPALKALAEQARVTRWTNRSPACDECGSDWESSHTPQCITGGVLALLAEVERLHGENEAQLVAWTVDAVEMRKAQERAKQSEAEVERLREEHITANRRAEYWKAEHLAGNEAIAAVTAENVRLTSARDSLGQAYASASLRAGSLESALRAACDFFPSQETLDDLDDDAMSGKRYCPTVTTPRIRDLRAWRKALAEPRKGE